MAEERYCDFSFAFNNRDHSNRVLTLRYGERETETIYVNTAILGKESEFFRRYFGSGFADTWQVSSSKDLRGILVEDRDCMLVLLQAIYSGGQLQPEICDDTNALLKVLMLSDEYRVPSVMGSCARALQRSTMNLALAVEVLILPQHIQESEAARGLIALARRFVEKAFPDLDAQIALGSADFWSLPLQAMECLLASPRVKVQSEDTVFFLIMEWAKNNLPISGSAVGTGSNGTQGTAGCCPNCKSGGGECVPANESSGELCSSESVNYDVRAEALRRLWALVRLPQMSAECLLAIRKFPDAAEWIDVNRIEEAIRIKTMDPRGVSLLYGSAPPYTPRPGKRAGPALLMWQISEKEIAELSGMETRESSERVFVCGNWYCIELRKTGLGTLFDNTVQIRLAERDCGPPGHPFTSIKGKRAVEASCTVGTPSRSRVSKGSCQLVCFGEPPSPSQSPTKADSKLNPNPNPNLGELTVGSKLWGPLAKESSFSNFGPKLNELMWDLSTQRYIHPLVGCLFDDTGNLQISIAFQPLSAWV